MFTPSPSWPLFLSSLLSSLVLPSSLFLRAFSPPSPQSLYIPALYLIPLCLSISLPCSLSLQHLFWSSRLSTFKLNPTLSIPPSLSSLLSIFVPSHYLSLISPPCHLFLSSPHSLSPGFPSLLALIRCSLLPSLWFYVSPHKC